MAKKEGEKMRIFRATYKDLEGKQREVAKWHVEIRDHEKRIRKLSAFTDKKSSEEFGRKLEKLVAYRVSGERPTGDLALWLESLPANVTDKLLQIGILNVTHMAANKPLREHLQDWRLSLSAKNDCQSHIKQEVNKISRTMEACGFKTWSDISASRLEAYLAELRGSPGKGISIRTSNGYLGAFRSFVRWAVKDRRLAESPIEHLSPLNAKTDLRHPRRALSTEELRRLMAAARSGPDFQKISGPERALLYRLAAETGFRAKELRSLTRSSFNLKGKPPTITVAIEDAKNKREDTMPLRPETALVLQDHLAMKFPQAKAFNIPNRDYTAEMMRFDLEAAGIPYKDEAGRYADFHSLRHTFGTSLAAAGVHPKVAQDLMRHSTIGLTMDIYTHTALASRSEALAALPDLDIPSQETARATGTDDIDTDLASYLAFQKQSGLIHSNQSRQKADINGEKKNMGNPLKHREKPSIQGSEIIPGEVPEWSKGTDCKPVCQNAEPIADKADTDSRENALVGYLAFLQKYKPDLAVVAEAWDLLPDTVKAGFVATVKAATKAASRKEG